MPVGEICSREVIIMKRTETAKVAAELMRDRHVGSIVIVDDEGDRQMPVGLLTDRDIVIGVVAKGIDPATLQVGEIMVRSAVTVRESAGVAETIALMRAHGVRRAPVTDAVGALVGIVSVDDFIDLLAEEISGLARLVATEQATEARARSV